jgi:hypothetical protein
MVVYNGRAWTKTDYSNPIGWFAINDKQMIERDSTGSDNVKITRDLLETRNSNTASSSMPVENALRWSVAASLNSASRSASPSPSAFGSVLGLEWREELRFR